MSVGYLTVHEAARWASGRDLALLRVKSPVRGRVILGRHGGRLIAASDGASTLVMGPMQVAGKSSRIVIPAALESDGPVLPTSYQAERRRRELGEVKGSTCSVRGCVIEENSGHGGLATKIVRAPRRRSTSGSAA